MEFAALFLFCRGLEALGVKPGAPPPKRYIYEGGTARHRQWNHRLNYPDTRQGTLDCERDGGYENIRWDPFVVGWLLLFVVGWVALW